MLMDGTTKRVDQLTKEEFSDLMGKETVFDDVANRVYNLHRARNQELNQKHPLMVKMETSMQ